MNARTVIFLRVLGIILAILSLVFLWNSRDTIIDGKEIVAWSTLIVGGILIVLPKAEEPYAYKKEYPTYNW